MCVCVYVCEIVENRLEYCNILQRGNVGSGTQAGWCDFVSVKNGVFRGFGADGGGMTNTTVGAGGHGATRVVPLCDDSKAHVILCGFPPGIAAGGQP